jgi:hypothetical protein
MKKSIITILATSALFGFEFQPLGFTSVGMGGAGVASAKGSNALYYNPALLAKHRYSAEFSLGVGIGGREYNLINRIDRLANEDDLTNTIDHIAKNAPKSGSNKAGGYDKKMQDALKQLYALSQGNGFSIQPTAEFSAQMGNFGIGVFGVGDLTSKAVIDREHLYVIVKDTKGSGYYYYDPQRDVYGASSKDLYEKYSLEYALDNNLTYLSINGIGIAEVPVGYAHSFDIKNSTLSIGIALKYMQAYTYKNKLAIDTDSNSLDNSLNDNKETSTDLGVDLGLLLSAEKIDIGLVGKYLNSPKFKYYDGSEYKIKPMVRGGINLEFTNWLEFAMDIDLTKNDTGIKDYKSQYIGGGFNIHQSWFSIRAGAMRNMVQDEEGTIITAGLGLGLKWFQLDVAAEASTKTGTYDGNDVPRYVKVNVALLSRWGGN